MRKKQQDALDRRNFLKVAAGSGAALVASPASMSAQRSGAPRTAPEAGEQQAPAAEAGGKPGSDFMVDVFKPLGFEYVAVLPHSSSRGLQESIINYAGNQNPEL